MNFNESEVALLKVALVSLQDWRISTYSMPEAAIDALLAKLNPPAAEPAPIEPAPAEPAPAQAPEGE